MSDSLSKPFETATSSNLFLDRKNDGNKKEEFQLRMLSDFYKKCQMIPESKEDLLRAYIRESLVRQSRRRL